MDFGKEYLFFLCLLKYHSVGKGYHSVVKRIHFFLTMLICDQKDKEAYGWICIINFVNYVTKMDIGFRKSLNWRNNL